MCVWSATHHLYSPGLSASLPVTAVALPVTETAAAGGVRLEGQGLVESGPSVLIGFVIGINRN